MAKTVYKPEHPELKDRLHITHEDGRLKLHLDSSLVPGREDVLGRLREASGTDALKELGDDNVARVLGHLHEEHQQLEEKPWMRAQRRALGLTIAALAEHLRQSGAGYSLPDQLRQLVESHGETALSALSVGPMEQPSWFARLVGGTAHRVRDSMPSARHARDNLAFVGDIESGKFDGGDYSPLLPDPERRRKRERPSRRDTEAHPLTERERKLYGLLMSAGGRNADKTSQVINEFFEDRRPYSLYDYEQRDLLKTLDETVIPGVEWYLENRGRIRESLPDYMRSLLEFRVNDPHAGMFSTIPSEIRFDLELMRFASQKTTEVLGDRNFSSSLPHFLSLCKTREDIERLFSSIGRGDLEYDSGFLRRAETLDDLISRKKVMGDFSVQVYDRLSPTVPPEERTQFEETLGRLNGIYRQYDTWPNRERKIEGIQSWGDLKAVAPLLFELQDSQDKPQTLSGMADRIASLTPHQLEVFENAITAGYFRDIQQGLYHLAQLDRDERLLSGVCARYPPEKADGELRRVLTFLHGLREDYSGGAGVAREAIDAELARPEPDLASACASFEEVYRIAGSYSREGRTPLRSAEVLRIGVASRRERGGNEAFEAAVGGFSGFCSRMGALVEDEGNVNLVWALENNAADYLTAFLGNPEAGEVGGRLESYVGRLSSNTGGQSRSWVLQSGTAGGQYGESRGILTDAVRAYNASGRNMAVLDGILAEVRNPEEFNVETGSGYYSHRENHFAEFCTFARSILHALDGHPDTIAILRHTRENIGVFHSSFSDSGIHVPATEGGQSTRSVDLVGAACALVKAGGNADDFRAMTEGCAGIISRAEEAGVSVSSVRQGLTTLLHYAGDAATARRCVDWLSGDPERLRLLESGFFPQAIASFRGDVDGYFQFGENLLAMAPREQNFDIFSHMRQCYRHMGYLEQADYGTFTATPEQVLAVAAVVRDFGEEARTLGTGNFRRLFFERFERRVSEQKADITTPDTLKAAGDRVLAIPRALNPTRHRELADLTLSLSEDTDIPALTGTLDRLPEEANRVYLEAGARHPQEFIDTAASLEGGKSASYLRLAQRDERLQNLLAQRDERLQNFARDGRVIGFFRTWSDEEADRLTGAVQELARDNPRFDGIREVFSSIREPTERAGLFEVLRQQDLLRIPEGGVQPLGSWDDMRRQLTTLGIAAVASPPAFGRVYPGFIANARLGYDFQDRADVETELPQVERTAVMLLSSVTPENYWALRETVRCSPTTSMDVILELRQLALDIESMCADSAQGLPEGQARTERARQGNDIHEAIHNHPSPRNLDLINGFLDEPWLTPDMRQTALRTREILEDIYHVGSASSDKVDRRFAELNVEGVQDEGLRERLNRFRDVAADDVRAARELGGVRLAVRDGILSPDTAPEERLHLMQIDLFLEELGYGLYSSAHERLEEGPASMPERLRLMDSIIQSQVANGMCNPGMTALGRQLTELADKPEWEREDYMRAFGVMAHLSRETDGMITQLHHSFDPILPEVASQRRMEPKNPHIIGFVDNIMRAQPLHMLMEVYIPPVRDMVTGELGELSRAVDPTLQRQVSTLLSERPPEEVEQNIFFFAPGRVEGSGEMSHVLGGKGAKLAEMAALGLPVPPGFTVRAGVEDVEGIRDEVVAAVRELEEVTGRTFGGRENPLLVSVRSGARLSMPGMMDTVLNLGLNDDVVAGLSDRHGEEFAYDCYERFLRMYGRTVLGIRDERFERREKDASGGDFKRLAAAHKKTIADTGLSVPEDPIEQLMGAVGGVQRSWESPRARQYRALHGIPNEWGTAVNVQQMVFGNLGENSGTGVVFSRDKETGENVTRINYLENAQGEDVVAGVRTPLTSIPDERIQREVEETTRRLEQHFKDMVDVELTVQEGKLFILQVRSGKRSHEARARIAVEQALSGLITPEEALERVNLDILDRELTSAAMEPMARSAVTPIATAPNLSFGAAAGVIALSPDKARELHQQGTPVILVRRNTSPEDFEGMLYAQGVLTAEGGANSHAAITCNGLNKPCLPGCPGVQVDEARGIVRIGGVELREGIDALTFDGETGEIFRGALPLIQGESNPYLETLRDWEREVNA